MENLSSRPGDFGIQNSNTWLNRMASVGCKRTSDVAVCADEARHDDHAVAVVNFGALGDGHVCSDRNDLFTSDQQSAVGKLIAFDRNDFRADKRDGLC